MFGGNSGVQVLLKCSGGQARLSSGGHVSTDATATDPGELLDR